MIFKGRAVFILGLVIFILASGWGCQGDDDGDIAVTQPQTTAPAGTVEPADSPRTPPTGYFRGFASLLPPNGDFEAAWQKAAESADFAGIWVGAADSGYWNLAEYLAGPWGKSFIEEFTRSNGMFPIINLSFIDKDPATGRLVLQVPPGQKYSSLSDPDFREAYKEGALAAVRAARPLYISLGNEVNRWYEQYGAEGPNGFGQFVSLYEEIYHAIKELSPQTRIFCIFAREIVEENREAELEVLSLFDPGKMDLLAFTSYPFAVQGINRVADIPDDYYSRASDYLGTKNIPFGFTELTWSTLEPFGGEAAQARFLRDATGRLTAGQGLNLQLLGWWSLYDLEADPHGTGLISRDGREKEAYQAWIELALP